MKNFNRIFTVLILLGMLACQQNQEPQLAKASAEKPEEREQIQVLNIGTFHMGETTDAHKTEYDEQAEQAQRDIQTLCEKIAAFRPTVICVELPPSYDSTLQKKYQNYLETQKTNFEDEVGLVAFEVGRLANTARIYGIDHKMGYDYKKIHQMAQETDNQYFKKLMQEFAEFRHLTETDDLFQLIHNSNTDEAVDLLITFNADNLAHINSEEGFEGADEAAKFYHRNLRIFANLNKLELSKDDRVFILSGATHAAFLKGYLERSHKFELVNTFDYLPEPKAPEAI